MEERLTKRVVDAIAATNTDQFIWDTGTKGFGLKVTPARRKVFIFQYRTGGRGTPTKRVTIGTFGELTVDQARASARRHAGVVAEGRDPRAELRQQDDLQRLDAQNTFEALITAFIEQYAKGSQRSWRDTERLLRYDAVGAWGRRPAASLTRRDVNSLLESVKSRAPITANRLLAALRKMFKWAAATGRLDVSPVSGIPLPTAEKSRDRVLNDEELVGVLSAADVLDYPFGPFVKLLFLTAQRRREVAGLRWSEITGDVWTIPGARTKNGRAHIVHLSPPALAVLSSIPRHGDSNLVFTTNGRTPISGFSRAKTKLDAASGVEHWTFHDIRRTVTTGLANLGHPPHVADKILNHTTGAISGVAAIYQKAEFLGERKKALDDWGEHVTTLLNRVGRVTNAT